MAFQTQWYFSDLPEEVVDLIEKDLSNESGISWVGGFVWHYILRANRENFCYELSHLDTSSVKIKTYNEGDSETWSIDSQPVDGDEDVRKLSFIIQLSDVDDYEGGNVQFLDEGKGKYFIPRQRGTVALFDARTQHRVLKVTKGTRKSLVGWGIGPQWK